MAMARFSRMSMLLLDDGSDRESLLGCRDMISAKFLLSLGARVGYE
jgi:hypothetical protein